jgi:Subtilase family
MVHHPHLMAPDAPDAKRFTSPTTFVSDGFGLPPRDRAAHAEKLANKLQQLAAVSEERSAAQASFGLDDGHGIYIAFESEPQFELKFESLDMAKSGVELCSVKTTDRTIATVYVPDGKLGLFLKKVVDYRDGMTTPRTPDGVARPKNQDLIESISDIKLAALEAMWTESDIPFPSTMEPIWWEVWLRKAGSVDHLARLRASADQFSLQLSDTSVSFIDRTVVLVRGTSTNLTQSIEILGMIAELRLPKTSAAFFTKMTSIEQQDWVDDLVGRVVSPPEGAPLICLLDSGLNHAHPLLSQVSDAADMHSYRPAWGTHDWKDHGTPMAGLASYGDLVEALESQGPIELSHRIESVKIIHQSDIVDPELYGALTQESAYRVEVKPNGRRVYCMAVTATDSRDRGRPSSWSAAVDALASGASDGVQRLLVLSAGNTDSAQRRHYPASNLTDGIHDPAQAWNALTVGGYTDKDVVDTVAHPGWEPVAQRGDLSPSSCTSMTWQKWPLKPDVVMEAGNMAKNLAHADPDYIDSGLQLLSTSRSFALNRALTSFGDTSASAALASRLAAMVWAKYPNLRPETVRGLIVHSAQWTPAMMARFTRADGSIDYQGLLRCFGYGVPNVERLMFSLNNSLTLISESSLSPFFKENGAGSVKTREMRVHPFPWPTQALQDLPPNTAVSMRVTLSYFVEPSPGMRGLSAKYGYQSHGLRFATRKPLETVQAFEERVNKFGRDEAYEAPGISDPGWQFGHSQRSLTSLGSIHSDLWRGTAAALASRSDLAVYPTMGWWSKRAHLRQWDKVAKYSLIVDISTPNVETDIYTPVANQIGIPVVVEV